MSESPNPFESSCPICHSTSGHHAEHCPFRSGTYKRVEELSAPPAQEQEDDAATKALIAAMEKRGARLVATHEAATARLKQRLDDVHELEQEAKRNREIAVRAEEYGTPEGLHHLLRQMTMRLREIEQLLMVKSSSTDQRQLIKEYEVATLLTEEVRNLLSNDQTKPEDILRANIPEMLTTLNANVADRVRASQPVISAERKKRLTDIKTGLQEQGTAIERLNAGTAGIIKQYRLADEAYRMVKAQSEPDIVQAANEASWARLDSQVDLRGTLIAMAEESRQTRTEFLSHIWEKDNEQSLPKLSEHFAEMEDQILQIEKLPESTPAERAKKYTARRLLRIRRDSYVQKYDAIMSAEPDLFDAFNELWMQYRNTFGEYEEVGHKKRSALRPQLPAEVDREYAILSAEHGMRTKGELNRWPTVPRSELTKDEQRRLWMTYRFRQVTDASFRNSIRGDEAMALFDKDFALAKNAYEKKRTDYIASGKPTAGQRMIIKFLAYHLKSERESFLKRMDVPNADVFKMEHVIRGARFDEHSNAPKEVLSFAAAEYLDRLGEEGFSVDTFVSRFAKFLSRESLQHAFEKFLESGDDDSAHRLLLGFAPDLFRIPTWVTQDRKNRLVFGDLEHELEPLYQAAHVQALDEYFRKKWYPNAEARFREAHQSVSKLRSLLAPQTPLFLTSNIAKDIYETERPQEGQGADPLEQRQPHSEGEANFLLGQFEERRRARYMSFFSFMKINHLLEKMSGEEKADTIVLQTILSYLREYHLAEDLRLPYLSIVEHPEWREQVRRVAEGIREYYLRHKAEIEKGIYKSLHDTLSLSEFSNFWISANRIP